jgi:hypothetical protein
MNPSGPTVSLFRSASMFSLATQALAYGLSDFRRILSNTAGEYDCICATHTGKKGSNVLPDAMTKHFHGNAYRRSS